VLAVVLVAIARGAWAVVFVTVAVTVLVCGYLLYRRTRRQPVGHRYRGGWGGTS
jgi:hypothetical protein